MKLLLLSLAVASFAFTQVEYNNIFQSWVAENHKTYASGSEMQHRFDIFVRNLDYITKANTRPVTYTLAMNEFGDLTPQEFKERLGFNFAPDRPIAHRASLPVQDLPAEVDWTTTGAVTEVKDQGQCGSCYAFSAVAALESALFLHDNKTTLNLSPQEIVDCSASFGNQGCNGGLMDNVFKFVIARKGICRLSDYPYTAKVTPCHACDRREDSGVSAFVDVPENDELALKAAVAKTVVSVAIEADHLDFQFYKGGVFDPLISCGTNLDHGVAAVGYGYDAKAKKMFWKVKNSWGGKWGEHGYIRLARKEGKGKGTCGIAMAASYVEDV